MSPLLCDHYCVGRWGISMGYSTLRAACGTVFNTNTRYVRHSFFFHRLDSVFGIMCKVLRVLLLLFCFPQYIMLHKHTRNSPVICYVIHVVDVVSQGFRCTWVRLPLYVFSFSD